MAYLNQIFRKFQNEMRQEHNLHCFSLRGSLAGNIKEISMKFNVYEKKSIEEARELEVYCIERLRKVLNAHEKIRPYLAEFPFPSERVGIMICFLEEGMNCFPPQESISIVSNPKGNIIYRIAFDDNRPAQKILEEPYRDAYEKVYKAHSTFKESKLNLSTLEYKYGFHKKER